MARLREEGILSGTLPVTLEYTSPACGKKITSDYSTVQYLREVNKSVATIHTMVPNPSTFMSFIFADRCSMS